jgi:hypothetical protein
MESPKQALLSHVWSDEDGIGGDDAACALRYLVATKGRAVVARKLTGV